MLALPSVRLRCLRHQNVSAPPVRPHLGTVVSAKPALSNRGVMLTVAAQNSKRRERVIARNTARNKAQKDKIKSASRLVKKSCEALLADQSKVTQEGDLQEVDQHLGMAYSSIDKAVKSGWLHRNTAARRKQKLAKMRKHVLIAAGLYAPDEGAVATA